ncbi:hypothetical protein AYO44_17185 [Planctomycetaceae bacterium SCGC AG-212-F19]|nr:hypothetical protein AYO44_17185 [Planctomycetaceae bacterium SCGC AG-212-F19]
MNRTQIAALGLVILGLLQMTGDLMERAGLEVPGKALRGIGAATMASPAPKVFSSVKGLETYSTRFSLYWHGPDGTEHQLELTPEVYARLQGPYNRRNVYGAALAFGPVLPEEMRNAVMRYALCGDRPLFRELGIDPRMVHDPVGVRYVPLPGTDISDLPRELTAPCP